MANLRSFLFLFSVFFLGSVLGHVERDVSKVQAALNLVNQDTVDCTGTANSYTGGFSGAVPVQNCAKKLNDDIKSATSTCSANAPATSAEATQILNYVNNTLEPNVKKFVTAIVNKKSQFTAAGLKNTVLNTCKETQTNANALADCLIGKTPSGQQAAAKAAKQKISDDIQVCITAYSQ